MPRPDVVGRGRELGRALGFRSRGKLTRYRRGRDDQPHNRINATDGRVGAMNGDIAATDRGVGATSNGVSLS